MRSGLDVPGGNTALVCIAAIVPVDRSRLKRVAIEPRKSVVRAIALTVVAK